MIRCGTVWAFYPADDSGHRVIDSGHRPFIVYAAQMPDSVRYEKEREAGFMRAGVFTHILAAAGMFALSMGGPIDGTLGAPLVASASAQVTTVDPNDAIDADLSPRTNRPGPASSGQAPLDQGYESTYGTPDDGANTSAETVPAPSPATAPQPGFETGPGSSTGSSSGTGASGYQKDDLIGAAEGVFGKGAEGLAGLIEDILRKQGEPNGYIVGREASGAFVIGLRYGSGTLHHKVEGDKPVYWTGPSIGFDAGANAGNTFVLVYNLYDSEDLYKRFGAGEGAAYLIGGFHTSYLRRGDIVLIPVRLGLGLRLGINAGYMKFTRKRSFVPF